MAHTEVKVGHITSIFVIVFLFIIVPFLTLLLCFGLECGDFKVLLEDLHHVVKVLAQILVFLF